MNTKLNIANARAEELKTQELLQITNTVVDKDVFPHEIWVWLRTQYENITESDPVSRAACSIINSFLYQERVYFAISRRSIQTLIKNDKNFSKHYRGVGFKSTYYSKILHFLMSNDIIKKVEDGSDTTASGFQVVDEHCLSFLSRKIDLQKQRHEISEFCNNINKGTSEGTKLGNQRTKEHKKIRTKEAKNEATSSIVDADSKVAGVDAANVAQPLKSELSVKVVAVEATESLLSNPNISHTEETPQVANPPLKTHQDILNKALSINPSLLNDFEKQFLIGKQEALTKYGSFKPKQIEILERISTKASIKSKTETLKPSIVTAALNNYDSPEAIYNALKRYALPERTDKLVEMLLSNFDNEEDGYQLLKLLNLRSV